MKQEGSINFLRERVRKQGEVLEQDRRIATYTGIGLVIFLLATAAIFGYYFFITQQLTKLKDTTKRQQDILATYATTATQFQTVRSRLNLISQIMSKRQGKWDIIDYLYSILPTNSIIEYISLSDSASSLAVTYKSTDIQSFQTLLASLEAESAKRTTGFKLDFSGLNRNASGNYDTSVTITLSSAGTAK